MTIDAKKFTKTKTSLIFTPRELEVMELVARSYLNKEIADVLDISTQTVKNHLSNIYRKIKQSGVKANGYSQRVLATQIYDELNKDGG